MNLRLITFSSGSSKRITGSDSIRDVMAFPKTASGSDLMSGAPSAVSGAQLKDVSLRLM